MKKALLLLMLAFVGFGVQAQDCSGLIISKYAEGYSNNRALEVYNTSNAAIDLSQYSVGRFRNGDIVYSGIALPSVMLQPYTTYSIGIDKRDSLGTCFEIPMWNGYQKWDVCMDQLTGLPIIDNNGDTVYCVQYQDVQCSDGAIPHHTYDTQYNSFLDLQGRMDTFANPVYVSGGVTGMYFNGDDAVALVNGLTVDATGSNIVDVVGVIGEDPGDTWSTFSGYWVTKDRTLVRRPAVKDGVVAVSGLDTLRYSDWDIYSKNTFTVFDGTHDCECDPNYVSTNAVQQIPFKVFPNPATNDYLTIEAPEAIQTIQLFDLYGQLVYESNINGTENLVKIAVPSLSTGLYVLSLDFGDLGRSTQKVMIQ